MNRRLLCLASRVYEWVDLRPRATVLTFHRFTAGGVGPELVRQHLECLVRSHDMVPGSALKDSGVRSRRAAVTVDDGHQDIFDELFPIALQLRVPFSIFLPTDYFYRQQWLWFDQIDWIRRNCRDGQVFTFEGRPYELGQQQDYALIKEKLKRSSVVQRQQFFADIESQLRLGCPPHPVDGYRALTVNQLRQMRASGLVEIGAHTATHTIATVLGPVDFARELAECKAELERDLEVPVTTFCYPNGQSRDICPASRAALSAAGFEVGMTSISGLNRPGFDPLALRRVHAHKVHEKFQAEVSGFAAFGRGIVGRKAPLTEYASILLGTMLTGL